MTVEKDESSEDSVLVLKRVKGISIFGFSDDAMLGRLFPKRVKDCDFLNTIVCVCKQKGHSFERPKDICFCTAGEREEDASSDEIRD